MAEARTSQEPGEEHAASRGLPPRYGEPWRPKFFSRVEQSLAPGVSVLDVGAGSRPTIPIEHRPTGCHYVGLDVSPAELAAAPPGSYDETWARDATERIPELENRFELALSWQVFEHVKPLDVAVDNTRAYLKPGGRLVAMLSGTFAIFGIASRLLPYRVGVRAMERLLRRSPETVFPSHYDRCWYGALEQILRPWSYAEIVPLYRAAEYFNFWPLLRGVYLRYEEWAFAGTHRNLASHYLIDAVR